MARVLLVDDDNELTSMLIEYMQQESFQTKAVHTGDEGLEAALSGAFDIVVLDIMMPRQNGIDTLRRIRQKSAIPVVMLTARGDNIDRIVGLDLGADDYVPKPCTPGELVARVRAILRRTNPAPPTANAPSHIHAGDLKLSPGGRTAEWRGQPLELTGMEFSLLELLAKHAGSLISKEDLSSRALGRPLSPFDRRIDVHISAIRQKLGPRPDGRPWIQSVRGQGYMLVSD